MRQRFSRFGAVDVVDLPVFDLLDQRGKMLLHQRAMLGLFDGNDSRRGAQFIFDDDGWKPHRGGESDAELLQTGRGVRLDRTEIIRAETKSARFGPVRQAELGGAMVEVRLGKAAAIVIAATKKQHVGHE
jgi:hypothetical protein